MNAEFRRVLSAAEADRRDLFVQGARRLGTSERHVEKDFWVCWALDALFNELNVTGAPRVLFKGGTSLSKAYGLINRFSEDIDITVFRMDLGESIMVDELEALGTNKRQAKLDAIRDACHKYITGPLRERLTSLVQRAIAEAGLPPDSARVAVDEDDEDRQTLLLWYPSVTDAGDGYVRPVVRIEAGAKSALDPHQATIVKPYVADVLASGDFSINNVVTVDARRTFWDKVVILHGTRRWFENRGGMRQGGERVSRHYYDVHRLLDSPVGRGAEADLVLGRECARHAKMFFNRTPFDLASAVEGRFAVAPSAEMLDALKRDYENMAGMIFGDVPRFEDVVESITAFHRRVNDGK